MNQVINVKNLTKTFKIRTNKNVLTGIFDPKYQHVHAVKDMTFTVNEGESLAFLGPNGAGKTTTTKMMTGLIYPTSGEVNVLGYTPVNRNHEFLMKIGLVMGNKAGLTWDLTPHQNFNLLRQIYRINDKDFEKYCSELTELLNVTQHMHKQVRKLSLGERMKFELIGAILHRPKVLFLDEPTIGLDITSKKNIRIFLREIQQKSNITLVLTSHDMDDIEKVCDRVIVVNKGTKVFDDNIQNLIQHYNKSRYIKVYFEKLPENLNKVEYAKIEKKEGDNVTFEIPKDMVPRFMSDIVGYSIADLDIISVPLEDMIEDIFNKSGKVESIA